MSDILEKILATKREEIALLDMPALQDRIASQDHTPRGFAHALRQAMAEKRTAVIAEIKKASPSKGLIREDFNPAWIAEEYAAGGAVCLSVLTDQRYFQGHNDYLEQARAACALPVIRKDFIIDEKQIIEAKAIGADAILLIAAALSVSQVEDLSAVAARLGLDVLLEVHNAEELDQALSAKCAVPPLLGINNRNLRTFEVSLNTTLALLPQCAGHTVITESGIFTPDDILLMQNHGVYGFLIGESLMRQPSPKRALQGLLGLLGLSG
jgi:indole-3-glycerol phosphate synthase